MLDKVSEACFKLFAYVGYGHNIVGKS